MKIAFDADGVLLNSQAPFLRFANRKYGTSYRLRDIRSFEFSSLFDITPHQLAEDFATFFRSPEYSATIQPFCGAQATVRALARHHKLFVVTARPADLEAITQASLASYFDGCFQNSYHTPGESLEKPVNKAAACKAIGAHLLVEDSFENAQDAMISGVPAVLIRRPWNESYSLPKYLRRTTFNNLGRAIRKTFIRYTLSASSS